MALSVRATLANCKNKAAGTVSLRQDVFEAIPVYSTNSALSLRAQLKFLAGHCGIVGPNGQIARGLWMNDTAPLFPILSDIKKFQNFLDFARKNFVNTLYLPLQPFNPSVALAAPGIIQMACNAPYFMSVELVYGNDASAVLDSVADRQAAEKWISDTVLTVKVATGANPVAIQIDVEPWTDPSAPQQWFEQFITMLSNLRPSINATGMKLTVAVAQGCKSIPITSMGNMLLSDWIQEHSDRVLLMDYFADLDTIKKFAADWIGSAKQERSVTIGVQPKNLLISTAAGVDDLLTKVAQPFADASGYAGVAVWVYEEYPTI